MHIMSSFVFAHVHMLHIPMHEYTCCISHVHACIQMCTYVHAFIHVCTCALYVNVSMHMCALYVHEHMHVFLCMCTYVHVHTYINIYVYIHTTTYVHIHKHMYLFNRFILCGACWLGCPLISCWYLGRWWSICHPSIPGVERTIPG